MPISLENILIPLDVISPIMFILPIALIIVGVVGVTVGVTLLIVYLCRKKSKKAKKKDQAPDDEDKRP